MIEYILLNVLELELKVFCGPDMFYMWSKFGQYDTKKNRVPLVAFVTPADRPKSVHSRYVIKHVVAFCVVTFH